MALCFSRVEIFLLSVNITLALVLNFWRPITTDKKKGM